MKSVVLCCLPMGSDLDANQILHSHTAAVSAAPDKPTPMADDSNHAPKRRPVDKPDFSLPSVRELAKQFTPDDPTTPCNASPAKPQSKRKPHSPPPLPDKEPELDYSVIPVSEIILALQKGAESTPRESRKLLIYDPALPTTQMEVLRKADSNSEHADTAASETARFNGKQVHSLTARSISKEFREGLKNSSYQKGFPRAERASSGGESDQGDVVCGRTKLSPTPSVDLRNMKKFWEEIITANSSSTKLK